MAGLLLAFGVNLGLFAATYDQQARVDAQLTLGADVVATAPPAAVTRHNLVRRIARVPGVAGVSTVDHAYASTSAQALMPGATAGRLKGGPLCLQAFTNGGSVSRLTHSFGQTDSSNVPLVKLQPRRERPIAS